MLAVVVAGAVPCLSRPRPARAQFFRTGSAAPRGTSTASPSRARASASARPNRLEIDLEVSAASELTADAIVKYRDAKKRLQEAFAALKMTNVAVEERGLLVDQKGQQFNPYYMDYQPNRKGKVEVQLTRKLVVTCSNIRKLDEEALLQLVAKLLDVAQDAGREGRRPQNDIIPITTTTGTTGQRRASSGSSSTTTTSSRRRPTARRSPTPRRGRAGWRS